MVGVLLLDWDVLRPKVCGTEVASNGLSGTRNVWRITPCSNNRAYMQGVFSIKKYIYIYKEYALLAHQRLAER